MENRYGIGDIDEGIALLNSVRHIYKKGRAYTTWKYSSDPEKEALMSPGTSLKTSEISYVEKLC